MADTQRKIIFGISDDSGSDSDEDFQVSNPDESESSEDDRCKEQEILYIWILIRNLVLDLDKQDLDLGVVFPIVDSNITYTLLESLDSLEPNLSKTNPLYTKTIHFMTFSSYSGMGDLRIYPEFRFLFFFNFCGKKTT